MKLVDVKDNTYIDSMELHSNKEVNDENSKFKVGDHVRISKYKKIFAKGYTQNWSEKVFVIQKVKNTVPWTYVINDLNGDENIGIFYEKELQQTNQQQFRIEKVKGDKLYVIWKGTSNKSKHLLVENKLKKLKTFDSGYFSDKSHFEGNSMHNYLVFQPM